jgi:hypothetical protein
MGVTPARSLFGLHSVLFYDRATKEPYGPAVKIAASAGIELSADFEDLTGGSEKFVLASEPKLITSEFKMVIKEFRNYLFEIFAGATVTKTTGETTGNVGALTNIKGTSVFEVTDGIASITAKAGNEENLKFDKFVVIVKSATTINFISLSDIDHTRGTDIDYQDDSLEVLAADITVPPEGATIDVPELGITVTGGSAVAVVMVVGDTAEFEVRPINTESSVISIGSSTTEFKEFGALFVAQKRSNGEMFEIEIFRCIGAGLPLNFEEKVWVESELTMKALKDSVLDKMLEIRTIKFE